MSWNVIKINQSIENLLIIVFDTDEERVDSYLSFNLLL